jgi:hypothetical protein
MEYRRIGKTDMDASVIGPGGGVLVELDAAAQTDKSDNRKYVY